MRAHHSTGFDTLTWTLRLILAQVVVIILLALSVISFSIPLTGEVRPHFLLAAVFYWAVYRPTLLPPWYIFILGLIMDTLSDLPLGMNALILVVVHWVVRSQRLYLMGQTFFGLWMGFAVTAFLCASAQWCLFALVTRTIVPAGPSLAGAGMTILLFPLISLLLIAIHRLLPVASKPLP